MTILGGLIDHSIAGRLLNNLVNPQQNPGEGSDLRTSGVDAGDVSDASIPPQKAGGGSPDGAPGGPDGLPRGAPPTGGPSPPQALPGTPGGGMHTGGPAPQGMQDVFPTIARQLATTLASIVDGAGQVARSALATPPNVPGVAAASVANVLAQPEPTGAQGQRQVAGTVATQTPQAVLANVIASAVPATVSTSTSQTATANAVTSPASPALAQPVAATAVLRAPGDTVALAQSRPSAETILPPRPENASLLSRLASALQLGSTPPVTTLPTLPTLPAGTTQAMMAAGATMAVNPGAQPIDARGAILAVNDHAAIRADNTMTLAGHTLDGLQRRPLRNRVQLPQRLTRLLWAMGLMGAEVGIDDRESGSERELQRVMQWLFWMLAVIAYGCLAVAIVALVGSNGEMFEYEAARSYAGWLAFSGLVTGSVAWIMARRMARR